MTTPASISPPPDKLSLAVVSGDFERVYFALVLASSAAATGRDVTLFFTMDGTMALAGQGPDGSPGWTRLRTCGEPGAAGRDRELGRRGVARFEELIKACKELGVRFIACETGLRAAGLASNDLRQDLGIEVAGAVTFLNDASKDGASMFV
ncbi:MAG: DsrE/DsrF/DrsH-like family protein [Sphingomonadales bacterium]